MLQDAIKCSFDNWKVWENYSLVGSDCGQFSEVIRAAHRILDLRGKWEDEMVSFSLYIHYAVRSYILSVFLKSRLFNQNYLSLREIAVELSTL